VLQIRVTWFADVRRGCVTSRIGIPGSEAVVLQIRVTWFADVRRGCVTSADRYPGF
jgi:hypothetical protein